MSPVALRALSVLLLVLSAGCRGVAVDSTHDPEVDFAKLHTYDWLSLPPTAPTAVSDTTVVGVLAATLEKKGMQRNKERPDVLIAVHRTIEGSLNTKGSGYEWQDGRLQRYELQKGSLVIDMVDPTSKQTIWRGSAEGAFRADYMPEERQKFLTELLTDMFADYPPRR